jgi:hypothetical protein
VGGKGGGGGRGEKWTKPCMHIWIIKEKRKKNECWYGDWSPKVIPMFVYFCSSGVWTKGLGSCTSCSTIWAMLPVLFALVIFEIGFWFMPWSAWTILSFPLNYSGHLLGKCCPTWATPASFRMPVCFSTQVLICYLALERLASRRCYPLCVAASFRGLMQRFKALPVHVCTL